MLSLLSGQLMPNVIAAAQYSPDRVEVFATEQSKADYRRFEAAIELLKKPIELKDEPRIIDAYDMGPIEEQYRACIKEYGGDRIIANITGGTKPMAIGLYRVAQELKIPTIYVITERNIIHEYLSSGQRQEQAIKVDLSIECYLAAHGLSFIRSKRFKDRTDIADLLAKHIRAAHRLLYKIRKALTDPRMSDRDVGILTVRLCDLAANEDALLMELQSRKLFYSANRGASETTVTFDITDREFLEGKWLEGLLYAKLRRNFRHTRKSLEVGDLFTGARLNEYDAITIENGRLAIFSCKTEETNKAAWIDELLSRARNLGRYCRRFIVYSGQFSRPFLSKAKSAGVITVAGHELRGVHHIVRRALSQPDSELI